MAQAHKRRKRKPDGLIVWTDAMYAAAASPPGKIGVVIHDPEDPQKGGQLEAGGRI